MDAQGKILQGKITIRIRTIRDAIDMMVAGIPMKYPAAGEDTWLQSAGMFEIRGYRDEKEIAMAPGSELQVSQQSFISGDYGIYYLNDSTAHWEFVRRPRLYFANPEQAPHAAHLAERKGCTLWNGILNLFSSRKGRNERDDFRGLTPVTSDTFLDYSSVRREFGINKFGVWNSDNPFSPKNAVKKPGAFAVNATPVNSIVYQVELNTNTLMSNYMHSGKALLVFNPLAQNIWFHVDPQTKTIAWMDAADFASRYLGQSGNNSLQFSLKPIDRTFKSVKEIREFLFGKMAPAAVQ